MSGCTQEEVSNKILTLANGISFLRLILAFVSLGILLSGHNIAATLLFAFTALTDCLDGQIARRTHTVTKLGQLLDPAVDRVLMVSAVLGLVLVNRIPLWIVIVVICRDFIMLTGGAWLLSAHKIRIPVVYSGKVATTLLFVGMAGLMLTEPQIPGLGLFEAPWLWGFNHNFCSWAIWPTYAGLILSLITTGYYFFKALVALNQMSGGENDGAVA